YLDEQININHPNKHENNITEFNENDLLQVQNIQNTSAPTPSANTIYDEEKNKTYYLYQGKLSEVRLIDLDVKNSDVAVYFKFSLDGQSQGIYGVRECK